MNTAHEGTDDMINYAESHPWIKRRQSHRALPLSEDWPTRRAFIPQGCEQQGRYEATIQPQPAEACTEVGAEDQSVSADAEVAIWLLKGIGVVALALLSAWFIAGGGHV